MKHTTPLALLLITALSGASAAQAAERAGVKAADQLNLEGKTLKLNGLGVRQATIFHVDVYVAGLWLERPSHDAGEILSKDDELKLIQLNFVHKVKASQMKDAWDESLKNNCGADCAEIAPGYEKLKDAMRDLAVGDSLAFAFDASHNRVVVSVNGKAQTEIAGAKFRRALLSTWLGNEPPNEGLKQGMLGTG